MKNYKYTYLRMQMQLQNIFHKATFYKYKF